MELTLKNYKTKLSAELLKRSMRCQVRECDELSPGVFESYVDEQDSSFDVKLNLVKNVVSTHSCECESNATFCQHKIALLNYIATGIKPSAKILAKKKIDPVRQALEDADHDKLKEWLFATLKKNKDLSIAFTNEFLTRTDDYDPHEIVVLTMDAVKAVINKRSRAEATEVKKIVDLWSAIHRPILDKFLAEPTNSAYFAQVHAVIDTCDNCKYRISTNSKRFEKYIKDIKDELSAAISIIREDESWSKSLSYFFLELFHEGYYGIRREYINLIVSVFNSSSTDRRKKINEMFVELYQNRSKESKNDAIEILKLVLDMVIANNEFVEHKEMFVPIRHSINYNLKLIDNLMKIGELGKAEMFCTEQVNANTNQEYDWAYTSRLKHIYTETNNEKKLIHLISDELLRTPDFKNYQLVAANLTQDGEFKKWRNKVLANARQLASYHKEAMEFSLALRNHEGDMKGLLSYIDSHADYDSILIYAKQLIDHFPELFMKRLFERPDCYRDSRLNSEEPEKLDRILEKLYQIVLSKFEKETLRLMVKHQESVYRSWINLFTTHAAKALQSD